jgi:hypothetical protein
MADDQTTEQADELELSQFDPSNLPQGTFAPADISDQPMWTDKGDSEGQYVLNSDQKNAIRSMVDAAGRADSVPRRIEVQGAWMLELLDRGFHRFSPSRDGSWNVYGTTPGSRFGVYGDAMAGGYYDTNVIGEKNDIIVALLVREMAESTFFPEHPDNPDDQVYADTANCLKYFNAEENRYGERQAEVARFMCTAERGIAYTRPVADAQRWGYEDIVPDIVPETEDGFDPDAKDSAESKQPKIRTVTEIFGKLSHKCPIMAKSQSLMQYQMISREIDISLAKSKYPWIASKIKAGDLNIAEIKLDRLARQSICLAMQSNFATGDSLMRDCTETYVWFRPGFYMDDSCTKSQRPWFWQNFEKGMLAVYVAGELAYVRNEGMDEVLTEFHARTGNGQNRRAITESYAGPQMRLNVLVDLWDEFCRKEVPRVGLNTQYFNVEAIRSSSIRAGVFEPFTPQPGSNPQTDAMLQFPQPSHLPTLPDFIQWIAGPLAEQLTHAQPALAASEGDDPETLGQSKLQNANAMSSFGESWKSILQGFANINTQAVSWNARVQPEHVVFDTTVQGKRRIAEIAKLKMGSGMARADGSANYPESWSDRQMAWERVLSDPSPMAQETLADPRNLAALQEFAPRGMKLKGVESVEKQNGEFDVLLKSAPIDNPAYLQAQALVAKLTPIVAQGTEESMQLQQSGQQMPPDQMQKLQQGQQILQGAQQALQTISPMISSVPVRGDGSENDAVEELICFAMMNCAEGRRLASSKLEKDQKAFQNLHMHWQQHVDSAKKQAVQAQQPLQPKASIAVDVSKLPPSEQASALQKVGISADPNSIQQQDQMMPHEYTTKEKGVGPTGSEVERTVSVVGKALK